MLTTHTLLICIKEKELGYEFVRENKYPHSYP